MKDLFVGGEVSLSSFTPLLDLVLPLGNILIVNGGVNRSFLLDPFATTDRLSQRRSLFIIFL